MQYNLARMFTRRPSTNEVKKLIFKKHGCQWAWLIEPKETYKSSPEMADQNSKYFDRNGHWVTFNKNSFNDFDLPKTCHDGGAANFQSQSKQKETTKVR